MPEHNLRITLDHERVVLDRGPRSGLTIIVAIHSTSLGTAVGGTRLWQHPDWQAGLVDALRLSEAMSYKNAAAGLEHGGGKAVIVVPAGVTLSARQKTDALRDLGDLIESLNGMFATGEDVGTSAEDMAVVRERTQWVGGLPEASGGSGEPAAPTAIGVYSAIVATARQVFGTGDLSGRSIAVVGLGQVGGRLARRLATEHAALTLSDIDSGKRVLAEKLGAAWINDPDEALLAEVDIVVPAALGGCLTPTTAGKLRSKAVVGPANNQLSDESVADLLATRDILWAPDFVVNAGGVICGVMMGLDGKTRDEALAQVERIGDRLTAVFDRARQAGLPPLAVALADARERIGQRRRR